MIPRTSSLREKGGCKAGGQPGHDGKTLKMTDNPDEIVEHRACFCPECGKDVSSQPFEYYGKRQVIDIPVIKPIASEHLVYKCTCTCGKVVESDFPVDVDSPVKYGKGIECFNGSEIAIRNVRVKQKISGQFKILSTAENFAILRSIIDTAIKNNQNVLEALSVIAAYKRN